MASLTSQGYGDFILLSGTRSPGLCDVSGASIKHKWDQQTGYGMGGAISVYQGAQLSEFAVKFRLYGDPQVGDPDWVAWRAFEAATLAKPPTGPRARAQDIWHPELERLKVKAVGVVEVGQAYQSGDGEWTIEVKFIQYRRPKITLAKPEGAKATPKPDEYERVIDRLVDEVQVQALAGET